MAHEALDRVQRVHDVSLSGPEIITRRGDSIVFAFSDKYDREDVEEAIWKTLEEPDVGYQLERLDPKNVGTARWKLTVPDE